MTINNNNSNSNSDVHVLLILVSVIDYRKRLRYYIYFLFSFKELFCINQHFVEFNILRFDPSKYLSRPSNRIVNNIHFLIINGICLYC